MTNFGLLIFATDYALGPDVLAREAEAHGFESLFFPEHTYTSEPSIAPVTERDPILMAKQVASLDFLSGGRSDCAAFSRKLRGVRSAL
jgi:alkanesulfonate monooxygenase SsuD/methylene tetrahydromethanopterin reductase-like flavin-dependent oxidoreductase (luciferase family)